MQTSGIHLLAELGGCSSHLLDDEQQLKLLLAGGLKQCGLHELGSISHKFNPIGVTVISIINESHVAIHTYPEAGHASIDIFHCSTNSQTQFELLNFLRTSLGAQTTAVVEICRGNRLRIIKGDFISGEGIPA